MQGQFIPLAKWEADQDTHYISTGIGTVCLQNSFQISRGYVCQHLRLFYINFLGVTPGGQSKYMMYS
jgi:hypothetical protein